MQKQCTRIKRFFYSIFNQHSLNSFGPKVTIEDNFMHLFEFFNNKFLNIPAIRDHSPIQEHFMMDHIPIISEVWVIHSGILHPAQKHFKTLHPIKLRNIMRHLKQMHGNFINSNHFPISGIINCRQLHHNNVRFSQFRQI